MSAGAVPAKFTWMPISSGGAWSAIWFVTNPPQSPPWATNFWSPHSELLPAGIVRHQRERGHQRLLVPPPVVPDPVDEQRRRTVHPAPGSVQERRPDQLAVASLVQVVQYHVSLHAGFGGVPDQIVECQRVLMLEEQVVHAPERLRPTQRRDRFGGLRGGLGVGMRLGDGEMAKHEAEAWAHALLDPLEDRIGCPAIGTFEVAVFDQGDLGLVAALDVVLGADG